MFLIAKSDAFLSRFKRKKGNEVVFNKLRRYWTTSQLWKFCGAHNKVLFYLDNAYLISSSLGLNRKDILGPAFVYADVNFIGFNLPYIRHGCPEMVLKGITGHS